MNKKQELTSRKSRDNMLHSNLLLLSTTHYTLQDRAVLAVRHEHVVLLSTTHYTLQDRAVLAVRHEHVVYVDLRVSAVLERCAGLLDVRRPGL